MSRLEKIENQIRELSSEELVALRRWFIEFAAATRDQQFEGDVNDGRLDRLADRALHDHAAGRSRKL